MVLLKNPELAKQGDQEAIAALLNHLLRSKNITAKVARRNASLQVCLESAQVPDQQSSVAFISKVMTSLGVEFQIVEVSGKRVGQGTSAWTESLHLTPKIEEKQEQASWQESSQSNARVSTSSDQKWKRFTLDQLNNCLRLLVLGLGLTVVCQFAYLNFRKTSDKPAPIVSQSPSPQSEPFRRAVNDAMSAAKLTQSAQSQEDWNLVIHQWQQAIALMNAVPVSSPHYAVAQKKVGEYQKNLDYASSVASRTK